MKLRAIELNNVRRFTTPVRIDGIGDGLNVLSEPNEFGKSTLFDALHAVFFKAHGSGDKEMKALRPHAGGAPEITVEVETAEGLFRISKRWFQKPATTVHQGSRLVAQSDAAEDWIARALGQDMGGPAGLIWVRQGMTALTDGSNKEQAAALEARRDLMSSVSEEVEAMTGGRRMDAALRRCSEELAHYATGTGRPRTGGPWKAAQDRAAELGEDRDRLQGLAAELHAALKARNAARRTLAELTAPEAAEARLTRLQAAEAAHAAAERHASAGETLARKLEMARLQASSARARLDDLRRAGAEAAEAAALVTAAEAEAATATAHHAAAAQDHDSAATSLASATTALEAAEAGLRRAEHAQAARDSAARRAELGERIAQADRARTAMETAKAAIRGVSDVELQRLETRAAEAAAARAARDAQATQVTASYSGTLRLTVGATELPEGTALPLTRPTRIDLPGIGTLDIRPPQTGGAEAVEAAQRSLREALAEHGVENVEEARRAATARKTAERAHGEARAVLASLAPEGTDALRAQLAALPTPEDADAEAPDPAIARAAQDAARSAEKTARATLATAAERLSATRSERTRTETLLAQARDRHARALAARAAQEEDEATLAEAAETARQSLTLAEAAHRDHQAAAPDLAAAQAALTRARSVEESARAQIDSLRPDLARLEERISRAAGEAVEERLAETEEALAAAQADLSRIDHEVRVLTRLQAALTAARAEARERYFAPVARALKPLLALLWPEAELSWSEDSLLPHALIRDGQEEPLDILSGGTQEQIALLVRLAFARMLADAGRTAPVILDDALVFTDDDRIERMFDALHRQAGDLQILVLTCRQRAFRDLGGQVLRLAEVSGA